MHRQCLSPRQQDSLCGQCWRFAGCAEPQGRDHRTFLRPQALKPPRTIAHSILGLQGLRRTHQQPPEPFPLPGRPLLQEERPAGVPPADHNRPPRHQDRVALQRRRLHPDRLRRDLGALREEQPGPGRPDQEGEDEREGTRTGAAGTAGRLPGQGPHQGAAGL